MTDKTVIDQLEQVRMTGARNMVMKKNVQNIADEMGFNSLVTTLEDCDMAEYMDMLEQL